MLNAIKNEMNMTRTENDGLAFRSTARACLDFFALCGALRGNLSEDAENLFIRAYSENKDYAVRTLFYTRDIRGGLGERATFRLLLRVLAEKYPESLRKNIANIPFYGRFDDMLELLGTPCEPDLIDFFREQLDKDISAMNAGKSVSLLAKWLPSVNASSESTRNKAREICCLLGLSEKEYRKKLSALRKHIDILESRLTEKDYTFDYGKQPSRALYQYRAAFRRNDTERYERFLNRVKEGTATLKTSSLFPYDIIRSCEGNCDENERKALDVTWRNLPDYTNEMNAIAVVDGSGSMYGANMNGIRPIDVAVSLGIYFAEHSKGEFSNSFITFSENPQLVEIKGEDIYEKTNYCMSYNEVANTNLERVFNLILSAAVNSGAKPEDMPDAIYIISDMEFDEGVSGSCGKTIFRAMSELYKNNGYKLPTVIYWNVCSHRTQFPVAKNEAGAVLVSGCNPVIFSSAVKPDVTSYDFMLQILESERYRDISA